jgi:hypothetical protein
MGADLIMMGTHGRSGVGRWILDSVADNVVHEAHAPVLLARPPKEGWPPRSSIVEKILDHSMGRSYRNRVTAR